MNQATLKAFTDSVSDGDGAMPTLMRLPFEDYLDPSELTPQLRRLLAAVAGKGIFEIMDYCFAGRALDEKSLTIAWRKFIAVAWLLHSEMLVGENGQPMTLEQLGRVPQLNCTRCALSLKAKGFSERTGFHSRIQKRLEGRQNYSKSAKGGWVKRRARLNLPPKKAEPVLPKSADRREAGLRAWTTRRANQKAKAAAQKADQELESGSPVDRGGLS